jgi:hypothetical protein
VETVNVVPHLGVGPVRLGMTRAEALRAIGGLQSSSFQVFYDSKDLVRYIEVAKGDLDPVFEGMRVLAVPKSEVVAHVTRYAPPDREDSNSYVFTALDLSLWQSDEEEETFSAVGIGRPGFYTDPWPLD